MNKFMKIAIQEAQFGIENNEGGPFGSVIVKDNIIIGKGHNQVITLNDPTCHGEMQAIRNACKNTGTFNLDGCILFTTGEPCHMCLVACMWANISKIYYGCTIKDNELIGFRDNKFNTIFGGREKLKNYLLNIDRTECLNVFKEYQKMINKTTY